MTVQEANGQGDALSRIERRLEDVEAALERLDDASYGVCASCGGAVSDERLAIDPTTLLCDRCDVAVAPAERLPEPGGG